MLLILIIYFYYFTVIVLHAYVLLVFFILLLLFYLLSPCCCNNANIPTVEQIKKYPILSHKGPEIRSCKSTGTVSYMLKVIITKLIALCMREQHSHPLCM